MHTRIATRNLASLAIAVLMAGCTGSKDASDDLDGGRGLKSPEEDSGSKITVSSFDATSLPSPIDGRAYDRHLVESQPAFTVTAYSDSSLGVYMTLAGGGFDIRTMTVRIVDQNNREIASGTTDRIEASGTMNSETRQASITTYAGVRVRGPIALDSGVSLLVEMTTGSGGAQWELRREDQGANGTVSSNGVLKLYLDVAAVNDRIRFALRVERLRPAPEGEHLPSAEAYRFQVRDGSGKLVWDSSEGMMFAQMIGSVQPGAVGESVSYQAVWDGLSAVSGKPVAPGNYTAFATIPSRPIPYVIQRNFTYRGR